MVSYLDTSLLVKLYLREPDSDEAIQFVSRRENFLINSLSELELASTFFRNFAITALRHGADEMATYDSRLAAAAAATGLTVVPARS